MPVITILRAILLCTAFANLLRALQCLERQALLISLRRTDSRAFEILYFLAEERYGHKRWWCIRWSVAASQTIEREREILRQSFNLLGIACLLRSYSAIN